MADHFIDLGTGLDTRIRLAFGEHGGRLTVELSGGQTAPLLLERAPLTIDPAALDAEETELLAPYLAAHPRAGLVRFRRDPFGDYELDSGVADHPFRFFSSLLLAALESGAPETGLRLVAVTGLAGETRGPIATVKALFHLVERA